MVISRNQKGVLYTRTNAMRDEQIKVKSLVDAVFLVAIRRKIRVEADGESFLSAVRIGTGGEQSNGRHAGNDHG